MLSSAFIKGFSTTAGLIVAIGPQNAFILRQGLLRSHVFTLTFLAILIDSLMITLGVSGLGIVIAHNETLYLVAKYGGFGFLLLYGCRCFYSSIFISNSLEKVQQKGKVSAKAAILTLMAMSFLNPHMYLDTFLLIGTIGGQLDQLQRTDFIIGATMASFAWFSLLAFGARYLAPLFAKPIAWKILDGIIGIIMWSIAFSLLK
jgi:L-lysine exporter family protein LysE/ArgO